MNELNLSGVSSPLPLRWIKGIEKNEIEVRICISGGNKQPDVISAFCKIFKPVESLESQRYRYTNAVPHILIGLNHFNLDVSTKIPEGTPQYLISVHTKLEWLIYGAATEENKPSKHFHICNCLMEDNKLKQLFKSFYAIENVGVSANGPLLTDKDKKL